MKVDHENMRPDISLNGQNSIEVPSGTVVYCLLVGCEEMMDSREPIDSFPPSRAMFMEYALILRPSNLSKTTFQRIDLLDIPKHRGWFNHLSNDVFVIERGNGSEILPKTQ